MVVAEAETATMTVEAGSAAREAVTVVAAVADMAVGAGELAEAAAIITIFLGPLSCALDLFRDH